jgi:hypothetical protein
VEKQIFFDTAALGEGGGTYSRILQYLMDAPEDRLRLDQALQTVTYEDDVKTAKALINKGARVMNVAVAAARGNLLMLQLFVENGAVLNPFIRSIVETARQQLIEGRRNQSLNPNITVQDYDTMLAYLDSLGIGKIPRKYASADDWIERPKHK